MRVLVTGGAGFIGSHITKILLAKGHQVVIYDDLSTGHKDSIASEAEFIQGSLDQTERLERALDHVDVVVHMAAFIIVPESVEKPMLYIENNILGTARLLEAMRHKKVKRVIFSSSATVYGTPDRLPLTENSSLGKPQNTYGATKACMEMIAEAYHQMYEMDVVILRYFNPYGPGERHSPETHAIPNFIKAALKKEPIPLYHQGEQVRDFIYVEDLALAHVAVLEARGLKIYNSGSEVGTKVKDVIGVIFKILGYSVPIKDLGIRAGDVEANYASSKLLLKDTGWQPKVNLEDGLRKTISYYSQKQGG
jgi:UDP-glucose 4-epimerase